MEDHYPYMEICTGRLAFPLPACQRRPEEGRMNCRIHVPHAWSVVMGRVHKPCIHRKLDHRTLTGSLAQILSAGERRLIGSVFPVHGMPRAANAPGNGRGVTSK